LLDGSNTHKVIWIDAIHSPSNISSILISNVEKLLASDIIAETLLEPYIFTTVDDTYIKDTYKLVGCIYRKLLFQKQ
jgi:hypothetical protein